MKKLFCIFLLLNAYNHTLQASENQNLTDQEKKELNTTIATKLESLSSDIRATKDCLNKKLDEIEARRNSGLKKMMAALNELEEQQERHAEEIRAILKK